MRMVYPTALFYFYHESFFFDSNEYELEIPKT